MAGERTAARGDCNFFNVVVDLTEEGIKHVDDIITLLFQYINMLKDAGPLEWIYDVSDDIHNQRFVYPQSLFSSLSTICTFCRNTSKYR